MIFGDAKNLQKKLFQPAPIISITINLVVAPNFLSFYFAQIFPNSS
jgi:hypothetical protein